MKTTQVRCLCGNSVDVDADRSEPTYCAVCGSRIDVDDGVERRAAAPREPVDWPLARRAAGFAVACALVPWLLWYAGVGERVASWMYAKFGPAWFSGAAAVTVAALVVVGLGAGVFARRRGGGRRTCARAGMLATSGYTLAFHVLPSVGMVFIDEIGLGYAVAALVLMPVVTGVPGLLFGLLGAALTRASIRPT